jgi:nucleoside-diphosphate-sugar epimerase
MNPTALIAGVTGIVGGNLAEYLLHGEHWNVVGLSRRAPSANPRIRSIVADLSDSERLKKALKGVEVSHVFITTWSRQDNETENCRVNGAMVANLLSALADRKLKHVALVTGTKHYLGPFEIYATSKAITPFREDQPRMDHENFYYTQEDAVFEAARQQGFTWSVHRPSTIIGYAVGNAMNMAATLAAYATICRETGRPFVYPGTPEQLRAATDMTDARLLARHLEWATMTPSAANEAFNIVNGEIIRWDWLWPKIAAYFGLAIAPFPERASPLVEMMADSAPIWDRIVAKHALQKNPIDVVASWWHSDIDLGRQIETFNDMTKSRDLGFQGYQNTVRSFYDTFDRLRSERVIP